MNHHDARQILPQYADGELDPERSEALEQLLADSAQLRDELARWRGLRQCVHRVVTAPSVPTGLENSIRVRLQKVTPAPHRHTLRLFGGLAAMAAAVVLAFFVWPRTSQAEHTQVVADDFAQIYLRCAVAHRHNILKVDRHDVRATNRVLTTMEPFPVLVPDLSSLGFQLDGVCQCFGKDDVHVVHAYYRRSGPKQTVVSVFSVDQKVELARCKRCPCRCKRRGSYEVAEAEGVVVCKWDEQGNSFAVCGRMESDQLRDLADQVQLAELQPAVPRYALALPHLPLGDRPPAGQSVGRGAPTPP